MNRTYLQGCRPFEPVDAHAPAGARAVDAPPAALPSRTRITFGFQGGESGEAVARKKRYLQEARERWSFLTDLDLSTIRHDGQLGAMVRDRSGVSQAEAVRDVAAWMDGKQF